MGVEVCLNWIPDQSSSSLELAFWEPWNRRDEAWKGRRVWEEIGLEGANEGCNELKSFSTFKSVLKSGLHHNKVGSLR